MGMDAVTRETPEDQPEYELRGRSSVVGGAIWMVAITLALFFLPLINGLIGGLVGGYKVGGAGRALLAALLPAAVVAIGLWLLLVALEVPVIGLAAGLAAGALVLLSDLGLLVGAVIGGGIASAPRQPRMRTA
jgi:hypothetical protein